MASTIALLSVLRKNRELDESQDAKRANKNEAASSLNTLTLAQEARLLIKALQNDELDEDAFLKFVNTPNDEDASGDSPESANASRVLRRRLKRIVQHLGLNTVGDEVAPEDIADLKGRLYRHVADDDEKHAGSLAKLRGGFMPNEDVVGALRDRVKRHLESRRGYTLCFLHVAFLAVFVAVLALHVETPSIWEVRRAIHRNIFAPGTVGGEDVTSVDTVVLDSRDDVTDWFLQTFIVGDGDEVFSDPACGDGVCTLPLEHAIWRDPTQQDGCELDCGAWSSSTLEDLDVTVELTADATLTSEEAAAVRWNLVCPEVVQFSRQLAYFAHDQRLSYPGPTTWTLRVFPCRWQLRLYAPVGGIGGTVTYAPGAAVTTAHIKNTGSNSAVQQVKVGATWSTRSVSEAFTWAGCAAPLPTQTEVLGAFRMCSSARRFLFNRSALADIAIQRRLEEAAKQATLDGLEALGLLSYYYDVSPACACAGPSLTDCDGNACPAYTMETSANKCPLLCTPSEKVFRSDRGTVCGNDSTTPTPGWAGGNSPCVDCHGANCSMTTTLIGDGMCHENFDCAAFACDGGDCTNDLCPTNITTHGAFSTAPHMSTAAPNANGGTSDNRFQLPCTFSTATYDEDELLSALRFKVASFLLDDEGNSDPICIEMQIKVATSNNTIRDFLRSAFAATLEYGDGSSTPWVQLEIDLPETAEEFDAPHLYVTAVPQPPEPPNSTCDESSACLIDTLTTSDVLEYANTFPFDFNPCEFLERVYGCSTDGCGCPYHECNDNENCFEYGACDQYPWTSCQDLESFGCDCSGCRCSSGNDCPRTCLGMSCDILVALSQSDIGFFLAHPVYFPEDFRSTLPFLPQDTDFAFLEDNYGCNCNGCRAFNDSTGTRNVSRRVLRDSVQAGATTVPRQQELFQGRFPAAAPSRRHLNSTGASTMTAELSAAWPLDEFYCDGQTQQCPLALLLNGVCDRACATASCDWDFGDCCDPTFQSTTQSLSTEADVTIVTLDMIPFETSHSTPYDAWLSGAQVNRYIANKHKVVAGILLDQTRAEPGACDNFDWTGVSHGRQVMNTLRDDEVCFASNRTSVAAAGTDPFFQPRSVLYDETLDISTCHPDSPAAFPFIRFPKIDARLPLQWASAVEAARQKSAEAHFFDVESLSGVDRSNVDGGYPFFFDNRFDHARARQFMQYLLDGFYISDRTQEVVVKFLLFNQDLNLLTYIRASFQSMGTGSVVLHKLVSTFNPTPYNGSPLAIIRIILEVAYLGGIIASAVWFFCRVAAARRTSTVRSFFLQDGWVWVDIATLLLQVVGIFLWAECINSISASAFAPRTAYDIIDLDEDCPSANWARFNTSELTELRLTYASMDNYVHNLNQFTTVSALTFLAMTLQLLHALHFQQKLNLITRTIGAAWADLAHLCLLFAMVEVAFALLGHVIYGSVIVELATFGDALATLLLCLFGNFDIALALGELYGFMGYFYYFTYMIISFLLLMNMLLAILVDAYIKIKTVSDNADGVAVDLYRQIRASARSAQRPESMLTNEQVVDKLDTWLKVKPKVPPATGRAVPIAPGYHPQERDVERILRLFLESDLGKMQLAAGAIDSETLDADLQGLVSSLQHHFGVSPRTIGQPQSKCCAQASNASKRRKPPLKPAQKNSASDTNGIELTETREAPVSNKHSVGSADKHELAEPPPDEKV